MLTTVKLNVYACYAVKIYKNKLNYFFKRGGASGAPV